VTADPSLAVVLSEAQVIPGTPGRIMFAFRNLTRYEVEVVSSAFELKRSAVGARHALPKAGWGYAVTDALVKGTSLPPRSELWTSFDADTRTTFRGTVPRDAPSPPDAQFYFAGRLLYRRFRGELIETGVYRRLVYPDLTCSIVDPSDVALNTAGRVLFGPA
jgi:hypothetical protein